MIKKIVSVLLDKYMDYKANQIENQYLRLEKRTGQLDRFYANIHNWLEKK